MQGQEDIIVVVEANSTQNNITQAMTEEEQLRLQQAQEERRKALAIKERNRKFKEEQLQRQSTTTSAAITIDPAKKDNDEKKKYGLIEKVYRGPGGRYAIRKEFAGSFLTRAAIGALTAGYGKGNLKENIRAENLDRIHNGGSTLENFTGFSGFLNAIWLAGTPHKDSSIFMKLYIYGQYFNPANYFLFCSNLLDEFVQDVAVMGLEKDDKPGVVRMTLHGIFAVCSSLQRFIISSACKPLVYARKNPKIFTAVLLAAAASLNTATYVSRSQENDDESHQQSLYDMYQNIALGIFDKIIIPMLGGMQGKNYDQYPVGITDQDKNQTIEALTAFLVNYSAVTVAAMSSQAIQKSAAFMQGVKLVSESDETRFVDGVKYGYSCITSAWQRVKTCVVGPEKQITQADALAALEALEAAGISSQLPLSVQMSKL